MLVAEVVQLVLVLPGLEHTCGYADIFAPWGLCSFMGCQGDVPAVTLLDMLGRCSQGLAVVLPDVLGEVLSVPCCSAHTGSRTAGPHEESPTPQLWGPKQQRNGRAESI